MALKWFRSFADAEDVTLAKGSVLDLTVDSTWMACVRSNCSARNMSYISLLNSGAYSGQYGVITSTPRFIMYASASSGAQMVSSSVVLTEADGWCVIAITKVTGSTLPRMSIYKAGAWTHANATSAAGLSFGAWTTPVIGNTAATSKCTADIAWQGLWNSVLSDANIETSIVGGFISDTAVQALAPSALWYLNQWNIGTPVPDWTGNGANEASHTGTRAVYSDIPLYAANDPTFSDTPAVPAGRGASW